MKAKKNIEPLALRNAFLIERIETSRKASEPVKLGGYFKKWGRQNYNGEIYEQTAFDDFINEYFVQNKLHVPINLMHGGRFEDLIGRVVLMERNTVGIWIEVELIAEAIYYKEAIAMIEEGVLQGFSDEGYSTDYDVIFDKDGNWDHCLIRKANLTRISLVDTPAEATAKFEIQNATRFEGFGDQNRETRPTSTPVQIENDMAKGQSVDFL